MEQQYGRGFSAGIQRQDVEIRLAPHAVQDDPARIKAYVKIIARNTVSITVAHLTGEGGPQCV